MAAPASVETELARINLMRFRRDYANAIESCRFLLQAHPENASLHRMMGDLFADQQDWANAVRWYELAVSYEGSTREDHVRLDKTRAILKQSEAAQTIQRLGLPTSTTRWRWLIGGLLGLIVVIGMIGFYLGGQTKRPAVPAPINEPFVLTGNPAPELSPSITNELKDPEEDTALMARLQESAVLKSRVVAAWEDPRSKALILTVRAKSLDAIPTEAVQIARAVFALDNPPPAITLRLVSATQTLFVGNVFKGKTELPDSLAGWTDVWPKSLVPEVGEKVPDSIPENAKMKEVPATTADPTSKESEGQPKTEGEPTPSEPEKTTGSDSP